MKGKFSALLTIFFFFLILLFPKTCVTGAGKGLVLWFHTVLPTLLPFLILTNLLLETGAIHLLSKLTKPLFCRLFHVSEYGSIVILSGFLCGYPLGSKFTADLLRRQKISYREASYLLSFCNNTSPMFIISFFIQQNLNTPLSHFQLSEFSLALLFCAVFFFAKNSLHTEKDTQPLHRPG